MPAQVSMSRTPDLVHEHLGASSWPVTRPSSVQTKWARGGHTQWPHPFPRDLGSHSSWGGPGRDQQLASPLGFCPNAPPKRRKKIRALEACQEYPVEWCDPLWAATKTQARLCVHHPGL